MTSWKTIPNEIILSEGFSHMLTSALNLNTCCHTVVGVILNTAQTSGWILKSCCDPDLILFRRERNRVVVKFGGTAG